MNKKISLILMAVLTTYGSSTQAEEFEQLFIQKHKEEILPELRLSKIDRYKAKGLTKAQIEVELEKLADEAANCQFKTFQAYESKYQQVAFSALLNGSTTEDAALQLNDALYLDVDNGKLSQEDMNKRVKKAMDYYTACVVNSDLVSK